MKRKTSNLETRIYSYGVLPPIDGKELFEEQLRLAHRYANDLVAAYQRKAVRVQEVLREFPGVDLTASKVDALVKDLDDARKAVKAKRTGAGKRADTAAESQRAKQLVLDLKAARAALREEKQRIKGDPLRKQKLKAVDEELREAIRKIRNGPNAPYWGTYLKVEEAIMQASKSIKPPRFRRYDGTGKIAVQLQGGLSAPEVFSGLDTRLRIAAVPADTFTRRRHHRRLASRTTVMIRAGSSDAGKPIWVTFPMILHRPLPDDASIKWAWILRRRVGIRFEYKVQLVVESKSFEPARNQGGGAIAIDVGWRQKLDGQIRVGFWADDAGRSGEMLVPQRTLDGMPKVRELRSIRDRRLDLVRARLIGLKSAVGSAWLDQAMVFIDKWRAPRRFARLLSDMRKHELEEPALAKSKPWVKFRARLSAWAKKDRHLCAWECHQRDRRLGHRREIYRRLAVQLAQTYKHVVVETFDLTTFAKAALPEDGFPSDDKTQRYVARLAAPGEFRKYLKEATSKYGGTYVERPAEYTTLQCHLCLFTSKWDARPKIDHTCEGCGATWDQDYNAAMNLLASAGAPAKTPAALAPVKPETSTPDSSQSTSTVTRTARRSRSTPAPLHGTAT
jgi:hypothetical protein